MERQRIDYLDIARGIGIVLVILGHCRGNPEWLNHLVFSVHVPLFFILSGYTFRKRTEDMGSFIRKSVRSLLIPYVLTWGIIILVQALMFAFVRGGDVLSEILKWFASGLYGSGYPCPDFFETAGIPFTYIGAIWFLLALFFARIGLMLCLKSRVPLLWVLVCFFTGIVTAERIGWFPFSIQAGLCAILYLYIGYQIRERDLFRWEAIRWILKILMLCVWVYCIIFCGQLYMVSNTYTDGLLDVIGSICGTFMIVYLAQGVTKISRGSCRPLKWIGRFSLGILCAHLILLDCFTPLEYADKLARYLQISDFVTEICLLLAGTALITLILYAIPWIRHRMFPVKKT